MAKLTKQFIESEIQSPAKGQRFFRDDDTPGFAVRATVGSKSFIFEKRVGRENYRITIEKYATKFLLRAQGVKRASCWVI